MATSTDLARRTALIAACLSSWTTRSIDTGLARRTTAERAADLTTWAAGGIAETSLAGITASAAAAVVRTTLRVRHARCAGIVTALAILTGVARRTTHTHASVHVAVLT